LLDIDPQAQRHQAASALEKIEGASAYSPLLGEGLLADKIKKDRVRAAFHRTERSRFVQRGAGAGSDGESFATAPRLALETGSGQRGSFDIVIVDWRAVAGAS